MARSEAAAPLQLSNSHVNTFLKIMHGMKYKPTSASQLVDFMERATGKKPVGKTAAYDDQMWQQLCAALNAKLQEWCPDIAQNKKTKKVFKYDEKLRSIARTPAYQEPLIDLIWRFAPPPVNPLPDDPEPRETEAPPARMPSALPSPAPWARASASEPPPPAAAAEPRSTWPTPAPWAPGGSSSTTARAAASSPAPPTAALTARAASVEAAPRVVPKSPPPLLASATGPGLAPAPRAAVPSPQLEGGGAPFLDPQPTASAAALWMVPPPPPPRHARQPAAPAPAAPDAEEPALTAERLEIQRLKRESQEKEHEIQRLKRKLRRLSQVLAQALDDAFDENAEQERMDADGASEPEQTVVTTSSVRDQVLRAGGSPNREAAMRDRDHLIWPECFKVRDLLTSGTEDEQTRLAPLIKSMTLRQEVSHAMFHGYFHQLDVEVGNVWLGRMTDMTTPLATVAFRTVQDVQRFEDLVRSGDEWLEGFVDQLIDRNPADRSASCRRLFFKNYGLVEFEMRDLEARLARYGQDLIFQVNSYWDGWQKQGTPTRIILSGYVEFKEESHANALRADLKPVRNGQEDLMVLQRIPGIMTPIAFKSDYGYENRSS